MNGICGWVGTTVNDSEAAATLKKMAEALDLRSPRHRMFKASPSASLGVFASRESQAHAYFGERLWIAAQGIVRWKSDELKEIGSREGHGAAMAYAYQKHGTEAIREIHGAFALAILDRRERCLLLAIDRAGVGSLLVCPLHDGIVFASTAQSVNVHPGVQPTIDPQSVFNYLYFHVVPSPRGIYRGHQKLLPGEYASFTAGRLERAFYWQPRYEEDPSETLPALISQFNQLLRGVVRRSMEGNRKTGAFLSGGTDSSTVAGVMTEIAGAPVETYSVGFDAEGFDEISYARLAARHFGLHNHEYYLSPQDVVHAVPTLAQAYDEPFGNSSAVATYYCGLMAEKDGIKDMLAGDGGDELFAGNERYAKQQLFEYYGKLMPKACRAVFESLLFSLPWNQHFAPTRKLQSYVRQAKIPLPDRLETYNFLHRTPLSEICHPDFLGTVNPDEPIQLIRSVYDRAQTSSSLNRMLYLDLKITLADNDLRKVSRPCALAGIDVRYPLLDDELIQFSTRIPPDLKLKGLKLRYFFKAALRDFLPIETLRKRKHGFGVPCGQWIKNYRPLRELAYDSLSSLRARKYLNDSYIESLMGLHQTEHATYYGEMIWVLMMLEQWLQQKRQ